MPRHVSLRQALFAAVVVAGCTVPPPPPQLAPKQLVSSRTPAEVVSLSARILTAAGFTLSVSDATAGLLTAVRERDLSAQAGAARCMWPAGSLGANAARVALTISVTAQRSDSGSVVQIVGRAPSKDKDPNSRSLLTLQANDTDCASTGLYEAQLADSLRVR